jgi:predicted subunit of tRNA(5-methylaminomethyl-2-thiouridylate) methyltransferase
MSPADGCVADGTPDVEIALIHWCAVAASDSTPPSVDALGFGSRAAASVPLAMFDAFVVSVEQLGAPLLRSPQAGCALDGAPDVGIALIHWCAGAVYDSTPPSVCTVGFGSRAAARVPELILLALVVSVEQLAAALLRSPHAGWVLDGTPSVETVLIHWCETAA